MSEGRFELGQGPVLITLQTIQKAELIVNLRVQGPGVQGLPIVPQREVEFSKPDIRLSQGHLNLNPLWIEPEGLLI